MTMGGSKPYPAFTSNEDLPTHLGVEVYILDYSSTNFINAALR
jgi:hypothetical protein